MHDPHGYYIPKPLAGSRPDPNFVYMEDFPINDSKWVHVTLWHQDQPENDFDVPTDATKNSN